MEQTETAQRETRCRPPGPTTRLVAALVVWLTGASALWAQATPIGQQFQVNRHTTAAQTVPEIAAEADGDYVLVWTNEGGSLEDVAMRRVPAFGTPSSPEIAVNSYTTDRQFLPHLAVRPDGDIQLAWSSGDAGLFPTTVHLRTPGGFVISEQSIEHPGAVSAYPRVTALATGNALVTWSTFSSPGDPSSGLRSQLLDADGLPLGVSFAVNELTTGAQTHPRLAQGGNGDLLAVWQSDDSSGDDADGWHIQGRLLDADGFAIAAEFQVNSEITGDQTDPAIAAISGNRYIVTWRSSQSPDDGDSSGVRAFLVGAGGSPIATEFQVNGLTSGSQLTPAVDSEADGDFVVVWRTLDAGIEGTVSTIHARRFDSNGAARGTDFRVSDENDVAASRPAIAAASNGSMAVVWESETSTGDDTDADSVQAQRFFTTVPGLSQPPVTPPLDCCRASDLGAFETLAEDLTLFESEKLNRLVLHGGYVPDGSGFTDFFTVNVFADGALPPQLPIASQIIPIPNVDREPTGHTLTIGGDSLDQYRFELTLAEPIPLAPGRYWLEVYNDVGETTFLWQRGDADPVSGSPGAVVLTPVGVLGLDFSLDIAYRRFDQQEASFLWHAGLWHQEVAQPQRFDTTSANVALADEIGSATTPPNSFLGNTLTYPATSTGLSRGFSISVLEALLPERGWTWRDNKLPGGQIALSPNDTGNGENDDFEIVIAPGGPPLTAFGMTIVDNQDRTALGPIEFLQVYGEGGKFLAQLDLTRVSFAPNHTFLGVLAPEPITRIVFDEDSTPDDMGVQDLIFAYNAALPIFADGFESGDVTAWSLAFP